MFVFLKVKFSPRRIGPKDRHVRFPVPTTYYQQHRLVNPTRRRSRSMDVDQKSSAGQSLSFLALLSGYLQARTQAAYVIGRTELCPETTTITAFVVEDRTSLLFSTVTRGESYRNGKETREGKFTCSTPTLKGAHSPQRYQSLQSALALGSALRCRRIPLMSTPQDQSCVRRVSPSGKQALGFDGQNKGTRERG